MKEQTRKDMRQKMADYQMSAPEVSWAEIEQAVSAQKRQTVVIPMWHKRIAVAAVAILIVGGAGLWIQHRQGEVEDPLTGQHAIASTPIKTDETSVIMGAPIQPTITSTTKPTIYSLAASNTSETEVSTQTHENTPEESNAQDTELDNKQSDSPTHKQSPSPAIASSFPATNRPATDSRLTAKVYIANLMNGYANSTTYTPMLMSAKPFGIYDDVVDYKSDTPLHEDAPEFKTSVRHHQPIRFGLSIRYDIGDRWSVESGLSYARHKSDITSQSGNYQTTTEQRLSYIGIPLNIAYRIWSNQHFNFYVSAGGMAEKMVKGSRSIQETTEDISIRPLQFSLNGMAGAEFRIDKSFSLYMEPGLSYYFDNGSSVPTIYQDEPLNFNLSVGLRFSFR